MEGRKRNGERGEGGRGIGGLGVEDGSAPQGHPPSGEYSVRGNSIVECNMIPFTHGKSATFKRGKQDGKGGK